jgi:hypothetical protein
MNKKRPAFFKRKPKEKEKVGRRPSEPTAPTEKWDNKLVKRSSEDRILHGDRSGLDSGKCLVNSFVISLISKLILIYVITHIYYVHLISL